MDIEEYRNLKVKIEEEYREKLKALELIWEMSKRTEAKEKKPTLFTPRRKSLSHCVHEVLNKTQEGDFTVRDVANWITETHPDLKINLPSLSNLLKKLSETNELEVMEQGLGSAPTIYKKSSLMPINKFRRRRLHSPKPLSQQKSEETKAKELTNI